jgi:hypothetical protein
LQGWCLLCFAGYALSSLIDRIQLLDAMNVWIFYLMFSGGIEKCSISPRNWELSYGIWNILLKYFREMDSLYSVRTCLVIVFISIYFAFLIGIFCLLPILQSLIWISSQNKHHLQSRPLPFLRRCTSIGGRQGYPKPIYSTHGWDTNF